ncbi:hypothetical protein [Blastopirellula retiformator]|uniref:Uncharacterized protein n=1 Tax=Blastopirellula retiformator TaxID=2527970 RepID=A0A5C5VKR9_9BACT|nr:hypothetical protein [Blastopirellula retiformator]TWT38557.1 hypothetical protein Enr8_02500 [Blastopirellula retiformator]
MPSLSQFSTQIEKTLGYLNFSSGAYDPKFAAALAELFAAVAPGEPRSRPTWARLGDALQAELNRLAGTSPAFADTEQAAGVLNCLFGHVLPGYLEFHRDLLFHQVDEAILLPFFVVRAAEATLQQAGPWDEVERVRAGAINQLNDYIGHRPIAALQSRRMRPYDHEYCRPVPIFLAGAGVSSGRYYRVTTKALELIQATSPDILQDACFDPDKLEELAFDPRAYDFDHPVNKRPNYQFGQWDPDHIDNSGFYRRFVVQQVTLDALMRRVEEGQEAPIEELEVEAAAVLAGVILMGAGISGTGPDSYASDVTLAKLLPQIAGYRDRFYAELVNKIPGEHGERLQQEAIVRRQPFGAARQHLNGVLSQRRARQLAHVHLAQLFARMGYPEEAGRQVDVVPTASARMSCRIVCFVTLSNQAVDRRELAPAIEYIDKIIDRLHRGIACGALVDPWNILGFEAQFSLFPSIENSVRDHRVDDLLQMIEIIMNLMSRIWSEAAAINDADAAAQIEKRFSTFSEWWGKFAAHEVSAVEAINAAEAFDAAQHVASALRLWHQGGAATGDVGFWAPHAEMFDSPKAYALVIEALLERSDFVASLSLLIHWLERADHVPLQLGEASFFPLAREWMRRMRGAETSAEKRWTLACRMLDFLEANAADYWGPPSWLSGGKQSGASDDLAALFADPHGDDEDLYGAAYEEVTYVDSTDDGVEGDVQGGDSSAEETKEELHAESRRVNLRLLFLECIARLWRLTAMEAATQPPSEQVGERLIEMRERAVSNLDGLLRLLATVHKYQLPRPAGDHQSMVDFDRQRAIKEFVLERTIITAAAAASSARLLEAAAVRSMEGTTQQELTFSQQLPPELADEHRQGVLVLTSLLANRVGETGDPWYEFIEALTSKPLLYIPIGKGGAPGQIVAARVRQGAIRELLAWLPRLGLFERSRQLLETARAMERDNPVGPSAVTEFDSLFEAAYTALVSALSDSSKEWKAGSKSKRKTRTVETELVECLEQITQHMLIVWLHHSRTLRLSAVEKFQDEPRWTQMKSFIETYGGDLFTQYFFNRGNIRSILHQGVQVWVERIKNELPEEEWPAFVTALTDQRDLRNAIDCITMTLEAVLENYPEYRDYNSTTTQSDRGELLYMFLDFLRLQTMYERIEWNLKPVVLAHEILVRRGHAEAAQLWRRALAERIGDEANKFVGHLGELQQKYSMRMPTIADRIHQRFLQPLAVDRVCSLVEQAMEEASGETHTAFELLRKEADVLVEEPSGVGLDVPAWLVALEAEVVKIERRRHFGGDDEEQKANFIPQKTLDIEHLHSQIDPWQTSLTDASDDDEYDDEEE